MFKSIVIKQKIILILLLFAAVLFTVGALMHLAVLTRISRTVIILLTFILYILHRKPGELFFGIFLLFILFSEAIIYYYLFSKVSSNNKLLDIVYLLSYLAFFNHVALSIKIKSILKKYPYHIVVSLIVGVFAFVKLNNLLSYHYTSGIASSILDFSFNLFVILSLLFSFFYYLSNKSKRALMLFFASFCIVLLEYLKVASYYLKGYESIRILRISFFLIGFYFLYSYIVNNSLTEFVED